MGAEVQTPRIAHVNFSAELSVDRKLRHQAEAARHAGIPIEFFVFSPNQRAFDDYNFHVLKLPGPRLNSYLAPKLQWLWRLRRARGAIEWQRYDVVIVRMPKLPLGWRGFLRSVNKPLITEHHTNYVAEIRGAGTLFRRVLARLHHRVTHRFLPSSQGVIAVTHEIAGTISAYGPKLPTAVIPNGITVNAVPFTGHRAFDGTQLTLIFVASRFVAWQGLDRLIDGLSVYRGDVRIRVELIGIVPRPQKRRIDELGTLPKIEVILHGEKYGTDLTPCFERATAAIASLGLYRKDMREACTLKVREYIARGVPFVYGYEDPDVPVDADFALRVPNTDEPINIEEVIAFARRTAAAGPELGRRMRAYAKAKLDWSYKLRKAVEFCEQVAADSA